MHSALRISLVFLLGSPPETENRDREHHRSPLSQAFGVPPGQKASVILAVDGEGSGRGAYTCELPCFVRISSGMRHDESQPSAVDLAAATDTRAHDRGGAVA